MTRRPSTPERSFVQRSKETLTKLGAGTAIMLSAVALAACSDVSAEGPTSAPTSTSSSAPETATPKPEKPATAFTGTINYESFTGFAEKDEAGKDVVCAEFFGANLPNSTVTIHSTGPEVAQWQADHLNVVSALNLDKSNPQNQEAARFLAECLTSNHESTKDAQTELLQTLAMQVDGQVEGVKPIYIDPTKVTRYSDGVFNATGETYGDYFAFTMEGHQNNLGGVMIQKIFEYNNSDVFPAYKLVIDAPYNDGDSLPAGGKPPIVLDPAYANAPWS